MEDETSMQGAPEPQIECPSCHKMFENNHFLIKHLLKTHCAYSGLICPYCPGHFPSRFIDLQSHVTNSHMEQLTGYNICNRCKVCQKQFSGKVWKLSKSYNITKIIYHICTSMVNPANCQCL